MAKKLILSLLLSAALVSGCVQAEESSFNERTEEHDAQKENSMSASEKEPAASESEDISDTKEIETEITDYDDRNCILISEESKELTFDEVVEQKKKVLNKSEDQIVDMLLEKENQIRSELDEKDKNGQDAVIHYFFTNGTFAYAENEDYQISLSAFITAVEAPDEKEYIHSVDELCSTLVNGKHHAVWYEKASVSTISIYKDTVRLAAAGFLIFLKIIFSKNLDFPYARVNRLLP